MSQHTPIPWGIEQTEDKNWVGPMRDFGHKVKEIVFSLERGEELKFHVRARADANAEFICLAVNNFKPMREAIQALVDLYADLVKSGDCGGWNPEKDKEVIAARAVLALAKGENAGCDRCGTNDRALGKQVCPQCEGDGEQPGAPIEPERVAVCDMCHGSGKAGLGQ